LNMLYVQSKVAKSIRWTLSLCKIWLELPSNIDDMEVFNVC